MQTSRAPGPVFTRLRQILLAVGISLVIPTAHQAQPRPVDQALLRRLEAAAHALLPDYPQDQRDLLLGYFVGHFVAIGQPDSAVALITTHRAGLRLFQQFIDQRMKARDLDGALALIDTATADFDAKSTARQQLLVQAASNGDSITARRLLNPNSSPEERLKQLMNAIIWTRRDSTATRLLTDLTLEVVTQLPRNQREQPIRGLALFAASIGDLSIARILDTLSTYRYDHATLIADLGANLRVRNDSRSDSVYARALQLAIGADSILGGHARRYYWDRYMPALSDRNALRFLAQMDTGFTQRTYLRGVMSIHLANGLTEVPISVMNEFASRGDTSRAVYMALEPFTHPIDYFLWQPGGNASTLPALLPRILELTAATRDTALRSWVRALAIEAFSGRDSALVAALRREAIAANKPDHINDILRGLVQTNPDSALALSALASDTASREWTRSMSAFMMAQAGRYEDAYRAADLLTVPARRAQSRVQIAFMDSATTNRAHVLSIVDEGLAIFEPYSGFSLHSGYLIPLMIRHGMTDRAVAWAEGQPPQQRAFAIVALLRVLW